MIVQLFDRFPPIAAVIRIGAEDPFGSKTAVLRTSGVGAKRAFAKFAISAKML